MTGVRLGSMVRVSVRFFDDEVLTGESEELTFEDMDFMLDIDDGSGLDNNERAMIPLSAVKWVKFPAVMTAEADSPGPRVAIRFLDGEVVRGHLSGTITRHRHGMLIDLLPEDATPAKSLTRYGIPFSAIKAMFYVREFDGRDAANRDAASDAYVTQRTIAPLLDVLEEMDMIHRLRQEGVLDEQEYELKRTQVLERL